MRKSFYRAAAILLALAGMTMAACSSNALRPSSVSAQCAKACDAMACPQAFRCDVDAQCVARCTPETLSPNMR